MAAPEAPVGVCRPVTAAVSEKAKTSDVSDMDEWISVQDELPTDEWRGYSDEVLAFDPEGHLRYESNIYIAQYREQEGLWTLRDYMEQSTSITHWMPLPEPPEE